MQKNDAIKKELLDKDPFAGYKLKKTKSTQIVYLLHSEIEAIINLDYSEHECLDRVRDLFLFSVYCGLRYSDVVSLRPGNLTKDATGRTWLYIEQHKTKELLEVPLVESAIKIIDKYKSTCKETGYLLPGMSNQKLNVYLKGIAIAAGISKRVTMHTARHSFASLCLETLDLKTVSKLLGHASIKSTEIYAKITKQKLSAAISMLNAANGNSITISTLN
jgi:integrase